MNDSLPAGANTATRRRHYPLSVSPVSPSISIDNAFKQYTLSSGEALVALSDVQFDCSPGEFVAIVGPSGCGKSTLLSAVGGLLPLDNGAIRINDIAITRPYTDAGFVFQQDALFEWRTVIKNVLLQAQMHKRSAKSYHERAEELLHMAGLGEFENRYPAELSGGMRQRVSICRALLLSPPVLLLDEPFGALDALTREQFQVDLQRYLADHECTVLLVTHDLEEAIFLSDRIVVMSPSPGRVDAIISIQLQRPRRLAIRSSTQFDDYSQQVRNIFLKRGVLEDEE